MPRTPTIKSVMTPFPHAVEGHESVAAARRLMTANGIHHLPVLESGRLQGILTMRDVERVEAISEQSAETTRVGEVCRFPVYAVDLDEPLDNVLVHMANERLGSVLVLRHDRIAGIFTVTDACRLLAVHLRRDLPPTGDEVA